MPITKNRTYNDSSSPNNPFYNYALQYLRTAGCTLSDDGRFELRYIIDAGIAKAGLTYELKTKNKFRRRNIIRLDYDMVRKKNRAHFYAQLRILLNKIINDETLKPDTNSLLLVEAANIREVLKKLCPIWPFC